MLMHVLLPQVVLPLLCFDEEDAELWEEDPQEFVRKVRGAHAAEAAAAGHICAYPREVVLSA